MNTQFFRDSIVKLSTLEETKSPLLSCYFDPHTAQAELIGDFLNWSHLARNGVEPSQWPDFDYSVREVRDVMAQSRDPKIKSVCLFHRWGENPFTHQLEFEVEMDTLFQLGSLPVIYPLIELKDRFHRFVVVIVNKKMARIFEISMGAVTESLFAKNPDLQKRIKKEWTKEHYQNQRHDRDRRFINEKVDIISKLMQKRGHNYLIIAGDPFFVNRLSEALPAPLQKKIVKEIKQAGSRTHISEIMAQAIEAFIEREQWESHNMVERLYHALHHTGLGLIGFKPCYEALKNGVAEALVISPDYPEAEREELVRLAVQQDIVIETVKNNSLLEQNGGVGCLLRYHLSQDYRALLESDGILNAVTD